MYVGLGLVMSTELTSDSKSNAVASDFPSETSNVNNFAKPTFSAFETSGITYFLCGMKKI